ncbi:Sec20-domain-containing protein [Melanomma pulvis-pyrius CBS 109.77]|uniref:Sec20-domain-containing protein n=1 Tax=Melanomma pulvis-pyrius CBS 109.77 TaxID=1314802 RepID=A0A6A6WRP3_9PLEO|nr:Sec20-domain-containing protein [Melanomma pulvis-pyrius CBS 109.77]
MPPLPTTTQALTSRLNIVSESNKSILQLIHRLSKLDFQPGAVPLNAEEGDVRLELSAEIHESLKQLEEELELLRQEVEEIIQRPGSTLRRRDSTRENETSRLAVLLARLTEDLKSSRSQYRKAQLTAKRNADRAKLKERELLFSSLQSGSSTPSSTHRRKQPNSQLSENEIIANASSDVTAALRRTHQLMQGELSRSRFAQETLEQSTAALADLGEKYTDLNTLLVNSRNLVTTLLKSTKSDTWYLETAFYILITTIIWLIFRRWLYGPISWFVWWPLKLIYRFTFAIFGLASAKSSATVPHEPRTSLIVKPSASGGIPKRIIDAKEPPPYIRVGLGGQGYNDDPNAPKSQSLSEEIGEMVEQSQQETHNLPQGQQGEEQKEPVRRGDGTVLEESDRPRNPKKRIWEENVESVKYEEAQAKAREESQQQQHQAHRKRDEL